MNILLVPIRCCLDHQVWYCAHADVKCPHCVKSNCKRTVEGVGLQVFSHQDRCLSMITSATQGSHERVPEVRLQCLTAPAHPWLAWTSSWGTWAVKIFTNKYKYLRRAAVSKPKYLPTSCTCCNIETSKRVTVWKPPREAHIKISPPPVLAPLSLQSSDSPRDFFRGGCDANSLKTWGLLTLAKLDCK